MSNHNTPDIEIAQQAYQALKNLSNIKSNKEFWGFIKGLPSMMVQEGMLQTLAFIRSKVKDPREDQKYEAIFQAINHYAASKLHIAPQNNNWNVIQYVLDNDMPLEKYLYLEQQVLNFTIWLKRVGLALIADPSVR